MEIGCKENNKEIRNYNSLREVIILCGAIFCGRDALK